MQLTLKKYKKKALGLFLFGLIIHTSAFSQADRDVPVYNDYPEYKNHRIGINLGAPSPMGDFDSDNYSNDKSGYANGGVAFELNYLYSINPNFSFGISWGGQGFIFDESGYQKALNVQLQGFTVQPGTEAYGVGYFYLQGKYEVGFKNKFYLNAGFGSTSIIVPELTISAIELNTGDRISITQEEAISGALGFTIGAGTDLYISDLISFNFYLQYIQANFEVETVIVGQSSGSSQSLGSLPADYEQPFSALTIGFGIGFNF